MIFKILLSFNLAFGTMGNPPTSTERQFLSFTNYLSNPGFESGKAGWSTTTTAFTITTTASEVFDGQRAAKWNPAGAESLTSPSWTPKANAPGNGVGFCRVRSNADADYNFEIYDGTNVIATVDIPASTSYQLVYLNFPVVGGTSYSVRVTSAGDDDEIQVDNCGIGYAEGWNIADISQAEFVGSAVIAGTTNCQWQRTNTAIGAFGTDTDCPGPTVIQNQGPGVIQTTDSDLPQFTVNNLPPGNYRVVITGYGGVITGGGGVSYAINDGTDTRGRGYAGANVDEVSQFTVDANFTYSTNGNRTFAVHGAATANTIRIANTQGIYGLFFSLYRYPLASQIAVKADTTAMSWSGYHAGSDCSWARANTAYGDPTADATCTFTELTNTNMGAVTSALSGSDKLPGIVFTPRSVGKYEVCASFVVRNSAIQVSRVQMVDGSGNQLDSNAGTHAQVNYDLPFRLCGQLNVSSVSSQTVKLQTASATGTVTIQGFTSANVQSVTWSIIAISQSLPAPLIRQSVVTSSDGVTGIEYATVNPSCSASPCTIARSSGGVSSITRSGTGSYAVNFSAGTYSDTSTCTCTGASGSQLICSTSFGTQSATIKSVTLTNSSAAVADGGFDIICIGPR